MTRVCGKKIISSDTLSGNFSTHHHTLLTLMHTPSSRLYSSARLSLSHGPLKDNSLKVLFLMFLPLQKFCYEVRFGCQDVISRALYSSNNTVYFKRSCHLTGSIKDLEGYVKRSPMSSNMRPCNPVYSVISGYLLCQLLLTGSGIHPHVCTMVIHV